jgi:hypothetical protein
VMVVYHRIVQLVADFPEKPLLWEGLEMKSFCKRGGRKSGGGPENLTGRFGYSYNFLRWRCVCLLFVADDIYH